MQFFWITLKLLQLHLLQLSFGCWMYVKYKLTRLVRTEWKFKRRKSDRSTGNEERVWVHRVKHCSNQSAAFSVKLALI